MLLVHTVLRSYALLFAGLLITDHSTNDLFFVSEICGRTGSDSRPYTYVFVAGMSLRVCIIVHVFLLLVALREQRNGSMLASKNYM